MYIYIYTYMYIDIYIYIYIYIYCDIDTRYNTVYHAIDGVSYEKAELWPTARELRGMIAAP